MEETKITDKAWNEAIGRFAFHLSDTHGFPKSEFMNLFVKEGAWDLFAIVSLMNKHKDWIYIKYTILQQLRGESTNA